MAGPHENLEHAEHAEHASHGGNKKIALLISVLALFLAFSETLGKSAQTKAITDNVTANDTWAFFQAKTIRMALLTTAAEQLQIQAETATDADTKGRLEKRIEDWKKTAARYDDDPKSNEGRKQLTAKARAARAQPRTGDGALPQLRIRLRRVPDRHRAGLGRSHHRHGGAGLAVRPVRRVGLGIHRRRTVGAERAGFPAARRPRCPLKIARYAGLLR